jgi:hypothetical protein
MLHHWVCVLCPSSRIIIGKHNVSEIDLFPCSGERQETPTLLRPLQRANLNEWCSEGTKRVGVSLPSPEDGERSSFRSFVFSSYLELQTIDKVHKPSDSEWQSLINSCMAIHFQLDHLCILYLNAMTLPNNEKVKDNDKLQEA